MNAAQRQQLTRTADLSRRTHTATGRHLTLVAPPATVEEIDAGAPSKAATLAEDILNDAAIGTDDRDLLLALLGASVHEQPGPFVEAAVEAHQLWLETLPDTADEDAMDDARDRLELAIRELVSGR